MNISFGVLCVILTLLATILKLTGAVALTWFGVAFPLLVYLGLICIIWALVLFVVVTAILGIIVMSICESYARKVTFKQVLSEYKFKLADLEEKLNEAKKDQLW